MREKWDFSIDKEIGVIRAGRRDKRCKEHAHRFTFDEWAMNGRGRMAKATGQFVTWALKGRLERRGRRFQSILHSFVSSLPSA